MAVGISIGLVFTKNLISEKPVAPNGTQAKPRPACKLQPT
jgi:hypothetical protein